MQANQKVIIKTYKGDESVARAEYEKDAAKMAEQDYFPISQNYAPGSYGCIGFTLALILCFLLVGILIFIYMLLVPAPGVLTVTYQYMEQVAEKKCPSCAENVREEAKICRFCKHEF